MRCLERAQPRGHRADGFGTTRADLVEALGRLHTLAAAHHRDQQAAAVARGGRRRQGIASHGALGIELTPDLLASRPGRLGAGQLAPRAAGVFLQLVGAVHHRRVVGGGKRAPDAIAVNRRIRTHQFADFPLVEPAGGDDPHVRQTTRVQDRPHLTGLCGEVAAVEPDAANAHPVARQFVRQPHHFTRGPVGIVGVDQQHRVLRARPGKSPESRQLAVVRLDEGMRHGPGDRYAVQRLRRHRGGRVEAADVGRARGEQARLCAVGAAQTEVDQLRPWGRQSHPRRLARDQDADVEQVDHAGFHQLRDRQRRAHPQHRLVGEEHRAFGKRMNVPGETQASQHFQERR